MPGPVQTDRPKGEARDLPQVGELSKGHRGDGERRRRLAPHPDRVSVIPSEADSLPVLLRGTSLVAPWPVQRGAQEELVSGRRTCAQTLQAARQPGLGSPQAHLILRSFQAAGVSPSRSIGRHSA